MQAIHQRFTLPTGLTTRKGRGCSMLRATLYALLFALVTSQAQSAIITLTFPEANGVSITSGFPLPPVSVSPPQTLTVPSGAQIVSASVAGSFGNDADESDGTTAPVDVFINDVLVARCIQSDPCTSPGGPYPWNFSLSPSVLNSGTVALTYVQTDLEFLHLGPTTLTIVTILTQTIAFGAPPAIHVNGTGSVTASTTATPSANYPITFSTTSLDCSVTSAGVVKGINAGSNNCVITASQAGDSVYAAASATQTFSIGPDATTVTPIATPNPTFIGTPVTLTATVAGNLPTGAVTFCEGASTPNASCMGGKTLCTAFVIPGATNSTTSCIVTFASAGEHSIGAYYAGDNNNAAATGATQVLVEAIVAAPTVAAPMLTRSMMLLLGVLMLAMAYAVGKKM